MKETMILADTKSMKVKGVEWLGKCRKHFGQEKRMEKVKERR